MNFIDEKCMSVVTLLINNPENILSINFIMRCVIEMKKDEVIVLKHSLEEKLQTGDISMWLSRYVKTR